MQLREGQSCIPFSKRRADKRVRKGQTAGVSPGTLLWVIWGAQGAGEGSVSPAMFITQCCWAQEMRALLVSWIALKKRWSFHLWGFFFTRYASVLQTFSTLTAALIHTFATGLLCRAWAPGIPSCHIPRKHEQSFCLCRVLWVWALAHMAAHLSCLIMRRSSCGKSVSVKSRGVHTAACTSWASLLGGMRYKCVSERGVGFEGTDWQGGWNRSFLEANTSFHFCLPMFCQEAFAVSRSWWLQPAVLKLFYPQADCAV